MDQEVYIITSEPQTDPQLTYFYTGLTYDPRQGKTIPRWDHMDIVDGDKSVRGAVFFDKELAKMILNEIKRASPISVINHVAKIETLTLHRSK